VKVFQVYLQNVRLSERVNIIHRLQVGTESFWHIWKYAWACCSTFRFCGI